MPKCIIDGKEAEFTPGQNIIEVAKQAGVSIPYFCYHPGLSVVAQCRMCYVEIEKMGKLQTACSTVPTEGMVIKTNSERVKAGQKATMEFLLINHPLDCPICDKSGECDLQDQSFGFGDANTRYTEERRTYLDLNMGPVIRKNMNRCIHCTRCIRFGDEVAGIREMVAVQRGNNTEITTADGRSLETDYAGNYADICPTGSLTLENFRFKKRVWFLKKTPTVCEGCSTGCNLELHEDGNVIYRSVPRENLEINKYWLCDEGRFSFEYVNQQDRLLEPVTPQGDQLVSVDWSNAIEASRRLFNGKNLLFLVGSDLTQEEVQTIMEFKAHHFAAAPIFHFGTPGISSVAQDAPVDRILRRKNKTANLNGLEKLGLSGFTEMPNGVDVAWIFRGGRATLPKLDGLATVGMGVFNKQEAKDFDVIFPGLSFAEKDGTIINFQGTEQKFKRAILPLGQSKAMGELLMMWVNHKTSSGAA